MSYTVRVIINSCVDRNLINVRYDFVGFKEIKFSSKIEMTSFTSQLYLLSCPTRWYVPFVSFFLQRLICLAHLVSTLSWLGRSECFSYSLFKFSFSMYCCRLLSNFFYSWWFKELREAWTQKIFPQMLLDWINDSLGCRHKDVHSHHLFFSFVRVYRYSWEWRPLFNFIQSTYKWLEAKDIYAIVF